MKPLTMYGLLQAHVKMHRYTKGRFMNEAPADSSARGKTHFRVSHSSERGCMVVTFHSTDIIRAYEDGSVVLDSGGWHASQTTRAAYAQFGYALSSHRCNGYSQTALYMSGRYVANSHHDELKRLGYETPMRIPTYDGVVTAFYDGMMLDPLGQLVGDPRPFKTYVVNRAATKEFRSQQHIKDFRAALPVLHPGVAAMDGHARWQTGREWNKTTVTMLDALQHPALWPAVIASYFLDTPEATWAAIYNHVVKVNFTSLEDV